MQSLSSKLKLYKPPEKIEESKLQSFQEYAINICAKFGVIKPYDKIIFKHAKNNKCYLEGRVALCVEKWGIEGCKNKGRYLVSLFRKNKPWDIINKNK